MVYQTPGGVIHAHTCTQDTLQHGKCSDSPWVFAGHVRHHPCLLQTAAGHYRQLLLLLLHRPAALLAGRHCLLGSCRQLLLLPPAAEDQPCPELQAHMSSSRGDIAEVRTYNKTHGPTGCQAQVKQQSTRLQQIYQAFSRFQLCVLNPKQNKAQAVECALLVRPICLLLKLCTASYCLTPLCVPGVVPLGRATTGAAFSVMALSSRDPSRLPCPPVLAPLLVLLRWTAACVCAPRSCAWC